jgi:hypothetical protein
VARERDAVLVPIHVTQEDIASGKPGNGAVCALGLACRRALPFLPHLYVYSDSVGVSAGSTLSTPSNLSLPPDAQRAVERLDSRGKDVVPFTFELDVPDDLIPAGAMS